MKLETFLHHLHFNTEKIYPPDWQVDWGDAPLPYKLYHGLTGIPLPGEVPLTLDWRETAAEPNLEELGHFLWYVYGITQYAQTAFAGAYESQEASFVQLYRRFVPSGGALYPNEVYVYLKLKDVAVGVYHYDTAHHRLLLLREGNVDSYLSGSLGNLDVSDCFCTVLISTVFWKNFYKYNNFSYRLQGLDAGVVIGQTLEVAGRMGFSARVCYQFLDRSLNHLLGLSEQDESVYAVIPLSLQREGANAESNTVGKTVSAFELSREMRLREHKTYSRSKRILDYPLLKEMNRASMYEATDSFVKMKNERHNENSLGSEFIMLPFTETLPFDLASICRNRHSPDMDFIMGKIGLSKLAALLKETFSFTYQSDLFEGERDIRFEIYGSFYNVEGVPDGAYAYDHRHHALRRVAEGDYRGFLQNGLTMPNINLFQVPLCLHIVGDRDHFKGEMGYRGYRIQQMEAGILLQRLLLVSCAMDLGGHPLLGFRPEQCDELFRLTPEGKTSLIQIPVGPCRPRSWLKGSISS